MSEITDEDIALIRSLMRIGFVDIEGSFDIDVENFLERFCPEEWTDEDKLSYLDRSHEFAREQGRPTKTRPNPTFDQARQEIRATLDYLTIERHIKPDDIATVTIRQVGDFYGKDDPRSEGAFLTEDVSLWKIPGTEKRFLSASGRIVIEVPDPMSGNKYCVCPLFKLDSNTEILPLIQDLIKLREQT